MEQISKSIILIKDKNEIAKKISKRFTFASGIDATKVFMNDNYKNL